MTNTIWEPLQHPIIEDGYLISPFGDIRGKDVDESHSYKATYHSTNGYDFAEFVVKPEYRGKNNVSRLFPIDEIIAMVYIPVPSELEGKPLTVKHINGDTRDISLENLEWVEDIEIWKDVTYPNVTPGKYQVSNHGHVKKNDRIYSDKSYNDRGYNTIILSSITDTNVQTVTHRIVAHEFCKKVTGRETDVNHINGDKTYNHSKNLEWVTHQDNMKHAFNMNMINIHRGSDSSSSKITNEDVEIICQEFIRNWGNSLHTYHSVIDKGIHVTLKQIQHIKHKECWSWLSDKYWSNQDLLDLHIKKIHLICKTLKENDCSIKQTLNTLSDKIPYLKERYIQLIRGKELYSEISDKYF